MTIKSLPKCSSLQVLPGSMMRLLVLIVLCVSFTSANAVDFFEAENANKANVNVSTSYSGYTGSGYVTNIISEWSYVSFDKSNPQTQGAQLAIRYANGTGGNVTNLALYIGSQIEQNLTFPPTASWSDWSTLVVNFTLPAGYQGIKIDGLSNVSTSVNIDNFELTLGISPLPSPTFSPAAGTYSSTQSVTISSSTSGASIRYTTDGSTPTTSSTLYSSPISVATSKTIKAIAVKSGSPTSAVSSAAYNITLPSVATPSFTPAAGTYSSTQSVSISTSTSGASIRYTTDGSTPTTSSSLYTSAISVSSSTTIKAIGLKSGMTNSSVATSVYTIGLPTVATPSFSPAGGTYSSAQSVTIATSTSGATIRYTTDGSTPTTSSTVYSSALNVAASQTIKAIAIKSGSTNSSVASASYTINTGGGGTPPVAGEPGVLREYWAGISGTAVSALTSNSNYPNSPTSSSVLSSFNAPNDVADNYGQRMRAYLYPTVSGSYTFYIAADDDAELWLSTNDNPSNRVKIASVTGWTNYLNYTKYPSQTSAAISLTAGNYYFIEAVHKEAAGGDHLTVAWQGPGISQNIITSANLVTAPPTPLAAPGSFNQNAPSNAATGVSLAPTFTWGTSSDAASYTLVVSTNSSYSSPVINQSGITATSFTPGGGLSGTTTYYWKVTAINGAGTKIASNAGRSFTTLTPPAPGNFTQTAPSSGASSVSRTPTFTWAAASNVSTYSLVVSTNSSFSSPVINVSGLTSTSYSPGSSLSGSTVFYWKVTAVNSSGSKVATNSGISFTTSATTGTYYYVATNGVDAVGRGGSGNPFKTVAYAATQVPANQNNTIYINAGTYNETQPIIVPLGVNIEGAGTGSTTLNSSGVALQNGVTGAEGDYHLWIEGSLIQLGSPIYSGANPRYGDPSLMIPAQDGNQTISGFTINGNNSLKAGVWVLNRNNVTMHHVNFVNMGQTGAVFTRGDMYYYTALPDGKWMKNTKVYDCNFTNAGSDNGQQVGCLQIGGIDGCEIYNININDDNGEGIKFMHVGHHRNTKIHDCFIRVPEFHPAWGEFMAIELWNLSYGNEVYNIDMNTWMSFVNFNQITSYEPVGTATTNLKLHDCKIVDLDGSSSKEAIEAAHSGIEIYNCYIQDKGFGIAFWNGLGQALKKNLTVRNNIFANVNRSPVFGFGNSAAVFIPDAAQNVKIYNNVFDRMGNGLQLNSANGVEVKNNVFINSEGADVENGSGVTFQNNLKYHTNPQKTSWNLVGGPTLGSGNVFGNPGFKNTGARADTYYQPASSSSFVVNKGINVGLPYIGSSPDLGRWEFGATSRFGDEIASITLKGALIYPNPTYDELSVDLGTEFVHPTMQVVNALGQIQLERNLTDRFSLTSVSDLPAGLYFVLIKEGDTQRTLRMIKK